MGADDSKPIQQVSGALRRPDGLIKPGSHLGANVIWADKFGKPLRDEVMTQLGAKKLKGGIHAESVWLLPVPGGNYIVEKRYGINGEGRNRYEIERKILMHLKDCDFVPKLLHADKEHAIIRMSYCGERPTASLELRKRTDKLLHILETKYGLYRKTNIGKKHYQLGTMGNITVDSQGKVYLIDFASDHWHLMTERDARSHRLVKFPPHRIGPHE